MIHKLCILSSLKDIHLVDGQCKNSTIRYYSILAICNSNFVCTIRFKTFSFVKFCLSIIFTCSLDLVDCAPKFFRNASVVLVHSSLVLLLDSILGSRGYLSLPLPLLYVGLFEGDLEMLLIGDLFICLRSMLDFRQTSSHEYISEIGLLLSWRRFIVYSLRWSTLIPELLSKLFLTYFFRRFSLHILLRSVFTYQIHVCTNRSSANKVFLPIYVLQIHHNFTITADTQFIYFT